MGRLSGTWLPRDRAITTLIVPNPGKLHKFSAGGRAPPLTCPGVPAAVGQARRGPRLAGFQLLPRTPLRMATWPGWPPS